MPPPSRCHLRGMDLSQLDFRAHPEAPRRTIHLQPMRRAQWNDHFYKSVYSTQMDPWRFPGRTIKFVVSKLEWLLLSQVWPEFFFFFCLLFPGSMGCWASPKCLGRSNAAPLSHKQSFYNEKKACKRDGGGSSVSCTLVVKLGIWDWIWTTPPPWLSERQAGWESCWNSRKSWAGSGYLPDIELETLT